MKPRISDKFYTMFESKDEARNQFEIQSKINTRSLREWLKITSKYVIRTMSVWAPKLVQKEKKKGKICAKN